MQAGAADGMTEQQDLDDAGETQVMLLLFFDLFCIGTGRVFVVMATDSSETAELIVNFFPDNALMLLFAPHSCVTQLLPGSEGAGSDATTCMVGVVMSCSNVS